MSEEIPEQLTPLIEGATHLHEMYEAYLAVGFSEERAFGLVTTVLLHYLEQVD